MLTCADVCCHGSSLENECQHVSTCVGICRCTSPRKFARKRVSTSADVCRRALTCIDVCRQGSSLEKAKKDLSLCASLTRLKAGGLCIVLYLVGIFSSSLKAHTGRATTRAADMGHKPTSQT